MDIWGLCTVCDAWFPCEDWFDRAAPEPTCPTCGAEARAIENRSAVIRIVASDDLAAAQ
jgi:hypothetical protein